MLKGSRTEHTTCQRHQTCSKGAELNTELLEFTIDLEVMTSFVALPRLRVLKGNRQNLKEFLGNIFIVIPSMTNIRSTTKAYRDDTVEKNNKDYGHGRAFRYDRTCKHDKYYKYN